MITGEPLFAGNSDIDQINCIVQLTGPFPQNLIDCFNKNNEYSGVEFPLVL